MICEKQSVIIEKDGRLFQHYQTSEMFSYSGGQGNVLRQQFQEIYVYAFER